MTLFFKLYNVTLIGDVQLWFDLAFVGLKPAKIYTQPEVEMEIIKKNSTDGLMEIPGCIIDNPELTMAIPLIDLDVAAAVEEIIRASKIVAGDRQKVRD